MTLVKLTFSLAAVSAASAAARPTRPGREARRQRRHRERRRARSRRSRRAWRARRGPRAQALRRHRVPPREEPASRFAQHTARGADGRGLGGASGTEVEEVDDVGRAGDDQAGQDAVERVAAQDRAGGQAGRADAEDLDGAGGDLAAGQGGEVAAEALGGAALVEVVVEADGARAEGRAAAGEAERAGQAGDQQGRRRDAGRDGGAFEEGDLAAAVVLADPALPTAGRPRVQQAIGAARRHRRPTPAAATTPPTPPTTRSTLPARSARVAERLAAGRFVLMNTYGNLPADAADRPALAADPAVATGTSPRARPPLTGDNPSPHPGTRPRLSAGPAAARRPSRSARSARSCRWRPRRARTP